MDGITYDAGEKLKSTLERASGSAEDCLRLVLTEGGGQFQLDKPTSEDQVFAFDGQPVLVIDQATSDRLTGRSLDCQDGKLCLVETE
jgi:hypothetical protein